MEVDVVAAGLGLRLEDTAYLFALCGIMFGGFMTWVILSSVD